MRFTTDRFSYALLPIVIATSLTGCDKLTPNGTPETIALLRAGSEKACVTPALQDALRGLIIPKPSDVGDAAAADDARSAIEAIPVTFDLTTLESADKSVSKVTCNTVIKVTSSTGDPRQFRLTYAVSPSAENPSSVVVSGDTDDVRAFIRAEAGNVLARTNAAKAREQEANTAAQAHQQLLAMVTPKWLVGTWITGTSDAAQCSNGLGYTFRATHRVEGMTLTGRWVLTQDQLHAVGQNESGAAEIAGTITAADPLSFTVTSKDGSALSLRRCTREEIGTPTTTGLPDSFAPAPTQMPES